MTDQNLTGPWILALGALAIGVAAIAVELRRGQDDDEEDRTRSDDERAQDPE